MTVFHVYVSLADFGGDPLSGILIEAVATPAVKKSGTSVHSNAPERAYTGVDGTCTLKLLSIPGVWYQIRPVHSKGVFNPVNLAGYVPDVDDPTTGEVFPADTEINLKDVVDEDPTPGYEGLVYSGPPNALTIGTVTTGAPGSDAAADIGGVSPSQTLDLVIPRGDKGDKGDKGDTGDASTAPGPANTLAIGTVTTGAAGTSAAATVTGASPSQTLNLTIPRGTKGDPGDSQLLEPGPNRFNAATVTLEYRVDHTTGALTAAAGWWASDFVPVSASAPYWAAVSWYRAYYDNTKTFISGVNLGGATAGATFTTPAGAAYVRDSYFNQAAIATQVIAEGSTALPWEAYRQQVPTALLRKVVPSLVVTDTTTGATLGDALTSLATVAGQPVNRANPATVTDGYWINEATGGTLTAGADWHLTDYIPVTAGAVYTGTQVWRVAWYTVGRAFISGSNLTPQGTKTFTAPALAAYLRISYWGAAVTPSMVTLVAGAGMPPVPYRSASLDITLLKHAVTVALPATIPALVGVETNLYFDGIVSSDYALYDIDVTCSIGTQQADRWTVVPAAAGTYALTVDLYRDGIGVARATTSVVVKAAAVGTGITKSVVVIGDSLIDNGTSPPTYLPTLFGAGDPMNITMLGTRGSAPGLHEGRSGWSTTTYTTLATSGGVTNAFWDGSAFSFPAWKTAQGYATVDYAIINLGINDIFAPTTDAAAATAITTALAQLGTMVTSITGTGTKVGICVTTPPARSQDAFGASYGSGQTRWRYRRNLAAWNAALIATFGGRTAEGIYLLPTNAALDTVNNFPTTTAAVNSHNATTSARQNNGVHCSSTGSEQLADVMHHWLKGFES